MSNLTKNYNLQKGCKIETFALCFEDHNILASFSEPWLLLPHSPWNCCLTFEPCIIIFLAEVLIAPSQIKRSTCQSRHYPLWLWLGGSITGFGDRNIKWAPILKYYELSTFPKSDLDQVKQNCLKSGGESDMCCPLEKPFLICKWEPHFLSFILPCGLSGSLEICIYTHTHTTFLL